MMNQEEFIAAVKAAVSEGVARALVEIRKDDYTKISLTTQLVESAYKQLADSQVELRALRADLRSLRHEVVDARSGAESWHELARSRDEQVKELGDLVAELRAEVANLKRGRDA